MSSRATISRWVDDSHEYIIDSVIFVLVYSPLSAERSAQIATH